MIACVLIPGFELRAALRLRPGLESRPAALGPAPGAEPLLGPVTLAAEVAGVRAGMRLGEALARHPALTLVPPDPERAESAWERALRQLEGIGAGVEPARPGEAFFEAAGLVGLWGSLERALQLLELHTVRSAIAGEVTKVYRRKGESVRQMEPLFAVANVNRLRIEGLCKVQQAKLVRPGMRALVEVPIKRMRGSL